MTASAVEQAARGRGRVLLIEGNRGVGKSTLLAETARRARQQGFAIASGRGRTGGHAAPGSALRHAIIRCAPTLTEWRDIGELIANLLSLAPLALVLDDAHLADDLSLRILGEFADRIASRPVLLAIARGPRLMDPSRAAIFGALRGREEATAITLRPLDDVGANQLLRTTLPGADRRFCAECAQLTGGNPFLLSELAAWIGAHRVEPVGGADDLSDERRWGLEHALETLPADQREVVLMRHVVGLTPTEISRRMGRSEAAVHGLHHRGRQTLRNKLDHMGCAPRTRGDA